MTVVTWWDLLGLEKDMACKELRQWGVVDGDGAHLTERANRTAAVPLCHRLPGAMKSGAVEPVKRPRWSMAKKNR